MCLKLGDEVLAKYLPFRGKVIEIYKSEVGVIVKVERGKIYGPPLTSWIYEQYVNHITVLCA